MLKLPCKWFDNSPTCCKAPLLMMGMASEPFKSTASKRFSICGGHALADLGNCRS
jgi:hypothetical protein